MILSLVYTEQPPYLGMLYKILIISVCNCLEQHLAHIHVCTKMCLLSFFVECLCIVESDLRRVQFVVNSLITHHQTISLPGDSRHFCFHIFFSSEKTAHLSFSLFFIHFEIKNQTQSHNVSRQCVSCSVFSGVFEASCCKHPVWCVDYCWDKKKLISKVTILD